MNSNAQEPRPSATLVVMRASPLGLQVLLLRRNSELAFFGGAWVFPGGRIDASDAHDVELERARLAAVRELKEEAGLDLSSDRLIYFARWVTPPGQPRRFDTWYFAATAPEGVVVIDDQEVKDHRWFTPREALLAHRAGQIELPPPTFVTLTELQLFTSPEEAESALRARTPIHYVPRVCTIEGGRVYLYEGDAGFETRDPHAEGARHRLVADADGWSYVKSDCPHGSNMVAGQR